ncbi:MAG: 23S rRNA (adenine(2030)-N(6))-methyltransferase RlmJ [Alphaproteobacteria bacterium]|nr:23S rRNA (adenine(2030)-N(6))-methyltransferase RlmJ [Alphaproteobacteria bacterium]MBU0797300.1 23S rRNA (adenine(2030)-N(6))-methyltransferase RlmJ [Alphaproteobacteria bacterium]MBU0888912.1 23S rRNA (adenine(2030)-N(6))-methyltransferase RlmJ [Alphaproteobacteria bacterium]MBU1813932.1 23S rRNA (adenine(2030)-N(6))-methyltransferase RlmJ [Alphaproteobacteria bacterium]MBU2091367.1 23S rRNA (adenine(2030)-N(6))-methyltransferase RlmJ [Alphaproteobacteria bacterium]
MNYRHAYHAGNFADVLKHLVLVQVLQHLGRKEKPFFVLDTHAGRGLYDLASVEAEKTGEYREGIGRLLALPEPLPPALAEYLAAVRPFLANNTYPGSPLLAQAHLRDGDRAHFAELHPEEHEALDIALGRDRRCKAERRDGYEALRATLPPKERRGVVLVDPPFEEKGEMDRLGIALREGLKRFATGQYLLWYPIKARADVRRLHDLVRSLNPKEALVAELTIFPEETELRLNGTGMVIVNPPYGLPDSLAECLPLLARTLAREGAGGWKLEQLA